MASTMASPGRARVIESLDIASRAKLFDSVQRLSGWLERNDYRAYDTFDGLNARLSGPLRLNKSFFARFCNRSQAIPDQFAADPRHQKGAVQQGHGLSCARLHSASRIDGR